MTPQVFALYALSMLLLLALLAVVVLWLWVVSLSVDLGESEAERMRLQQCLLDKHRGKQSGGAAETREEVSVEYLDPDLADALTEEERAYRARLKGLKE